MKEWWQWSQEQGSDRLGFAIIGVGRFGIAVCRELLQNGADVLAVDRSERAVDELRQVLATRKAHEHPLGAEQLLKAAGAERRPREGVALGEALALCASKAAREQAVRAWPPRTGGPCTHRTATHCSLPTTCCRCTGGPARGRSWPSWTNRPAPTSCPRAQTPPPPAAAAAAPPTVATIDAQAARRQDGRCSQVGGQ